MKLFFITLLLFTAAACGSHVHAPAASSAVLARSEWGRQTAHNETGLKYLLYLPSDYDRQERWPLIVSLHGARLRGDDLDMLKQYGLAALLDKNVSISFVVVSPQCPEGTTWIEQEDALLRLIDEISATYAVDRSRIYLTGHSMGGRATWFLASRHPEKFAAIVPLADGAGDLSWAPSLKRVPVWAFHGTKDDLASFEKTEQFVKALKAAGGDVKFTPLPDRDHFILDVYENKEIYDWLLQYKRRQ